jgi:hypothetical protein
MMKKTIHTITLCIILTIFTLSTGACDRKEPEKQQIKQEVSKQEVSKQEVSKQEAPKDISTANLFKTKCTKCHDPKRAEDMHASKESFVDIIKEMIKKGAEIDDQQGKEIAEFLATPSRFLLKEKCSKCHTLDRIYEAHEKGNLTKDTLKKMQQKEDSGITEEDVDSIYEGLNAYYFVSPQIPMTPGF